MQDRFGLRIDLFLNVRFPLRVKIILRLHRDRAVAVFLISVIILHVEQRRIVLHHSNKGILQSLSVSLTKFDRFGHFFQRRQQQAIQALVLPR